MNILFISQLFYPDFIGGAEKQVFEVAKRLAKKHEVHILAPKLSPGADIIKIHGLTIHKVFSLGSAFSMLNKLSFLFTSFDATFSIIKKYNIEVVNCQPYAPLISGFFSAKTLSIPVIATFHDVYGASGWKGATVGRQGAPSGFALEQLALKLPYDLFFTPSKSSMDKLVSAGIPKNKIVITGNGVDAKFYDKIKVKEKPNRIISIGRLVEYKHHAHIIQAMPHIIQKIPDAELLIVGQGPEKENLEELTKKLHLEKNVKITGFIKNEINLAKLLKSSSLYIHASSIEGFGISALEAMAAGKPVICTDIPALRELKPDNTAFFKIGDIDSLSQKVISILSDKEKRNKQSRINRKLAENYSWEKVADAYESGFRRVIRG